MAKVPEPTSQQTSVTQHANLANNLGMRVTAENLIANCNDLLALTTKLKKMLLISDYNVINDEVREQNLNKVDVIEQEMAKICHDF